jgi:hypothetical protein
MNPWLVVAIAGIAGLFGIMCVLHVFCDKLHDLLEGVILVMKYIIDKEHSNDGNDIFRGKNN